MPPRSRRHKTIDTDFLFVNEDFNTLFGGSKNTELDRSKQSHVQRQFFVRRKKLDAKEAGSSLPLRQDVPVDVSPQTVESSPDSTTPPVAIRNFGDAFLTPVTGEQDESWLQYHIQGEKNQSNTAWDTIENSYISQGSYHGSFAQQNLYADLSLYTQSSPVPASSALNSPASHIDLLRPDLCSAASLHPSPDPFTDFHVALEQWAPPLMRYYTGVMLCKLFQSDLKRVPMEGLRHVAELHADMQSCMTYPEEMYALLASTSFYILAHEGHLDLNSITQETYRRVPRLLNTKAIEALRLRLSRGPPSHGTAIAVHRMIAAAQYINNVDAVETNYGASLAMINELGGLGTFGDYHKERLIFHDLVYAVAVNSSPRLELSWDPGPAPRVIQQGMFPQRNMDHLVSCQRLLTLVDSEHDLGDTILFTTLRDIAETQRAAYWLETQPYRSQDYRWLTHRRLALLHRLLSHNYLTFESGHMAVIESAREALRLAAVLFMILDCRIPDNTVRTSTQVATIATSLRGIGTISSSWPTGQDLLLWIVVMAGICTVMTSDTASLCISPKSMIDIDDGLLFSTLGTNLCAQLEIETLAELRQFLDSFLFSDNLAGYRLRAFAEVGLGLRT